MKDSGYTLVKINNNGKPRGALLEQITSGDCGTSIERD